MRERPEDIDPADRLVPRASAARARQEDRRRSAAPARERLRAYDWPGNVRELRNCLERAIILADDDAIDERHLRLGPDSGFSDALRDETIEQARERAANAAERLWLLRALERSKGDRTEAARTSGLTARRLEAKLREHGLEEM